MNSCAPSSVRSGQSHTPPYAKLLLLSVCKASAVDCRNVAGLQSQRRFKDSFYPVSCEIRQAQIAFQLNRSSIFLMLAHPRLSVVPACRIGRPAWLLPPGWKLFLHNCIFHGTFSLFSDRVMKTEEVNRYAPISNCLFRPQLHRSRA